MDGNVPGTPQESIPPKQVGGKISFSSNQLALITVDTFNLERHLHFAVDGKMIIVVKEFEYYSYLNALFTEVEILKNEGAECICDKVETDSFEELGSEEFPLTEINLENNEVKESKIQLPIYLVYNFIGDLEVGIHKTHK